MSEVSTRLAGQSFGDRAAYRTVRSLMWLLLKLWCRMRVVGREHIPEEGPYVLAPTHRSIVDTPIASALVWRRQRFMGADKWWSNRHFGRLLTALGGFPVTRGSADREALKRSITLLEAGEPLVLFPEGERKSGPVVQPLFEGAAYVAMKVGVPVVPVGIGGSERVMPKGAKFVWPRRVVAIVGPPLRVRTEPGASAKEQRVASRELTNELHAELQRLFDLAQRRAGVPAP